ncbi:hypothetical protein T05_301 [Trichinella murrelli]|uniref:Uncharacterized protein n=1 Tax=Trichinella murrelli TaxID=144512 RepID=A0A0V0T348_9BILA|nr:hypothetical protein T05_301 [Trichinella murrelli]
MREKLRDGGGGSCHMRSSTQSSQNRCICISQCYWRYNDIIETGGGSIKGCDCATGVSR